MTKRVKRVVSPALCATLALLQKSPQSKLIRYLWGSLQDDSDYVHRNQESVERVISDVLRMHGIDGACIFAELTVFDLILEVAQRLKITKRSDWYTQF